MLRSSPAGEGGRHTGDAEEEGLLVQLLRSSPAGEGGRHAVYASQRVTKNKRLRSSPAGEGGRHPAHAGMARQLDLECCDPRPPVKAGATPELTAGLRKLLEALRSSPAGEGGRHSS